MIRKKLFLDFDNTITNSTKAFCNCYNLVYQDHKDFKFANWEESERYDFRDICPLVHDVEKVFEDPYFFETLEFIDDDTCRVLEKLHKKYQIIVVSIGTAKNLSKKALWLSKNLPFIKDYLLIYNGDCAMNKEIANMDYEDSIFIDDVVSNLNSTLAKRKYIYGRKYQWNNTEVYPRLNNWLEVEKELLG